jgi:hypothetical protein
MVRQTATETIIETETGRRKMTFIRFSPPEYVVVSRARDALYLGALSTNISGGLANMPIFEYVLVALVGAAGAGAPLETPGRPMMRTLTADVLTQPNGGAEAFPGQTGGGSTDRTTGTGRKGKHLEKGRHHRRHHRHNRQNKVLETGKKPSKT